MEHTAFTLADSIGQMPQVIEDNSTSSANSLGSIWKAARRCLLNQTPCRRAAASSSHRFAMRRLPVSMRFHRPPAMSKGNPQILWQRSAPWNGGGMNTRVTLSNIVPPTWPFRSGDSAIVVRVFLSFKPIFNDKGPVAGCSRHADYLRARLRTSTLCASAQDGTQIMTPGVETSPCASGAVHKADLRPHRAAHLLCDDMGAITVVFAMCGGLMIAFHVHCARYYRWRDDAIAHAIGARRCGAFPRQSTAHTTPETRVLILRSGRRTRAPTTTLTCRRATLISPCRRATSRRR